MVASIEAKDNQCMTALHQSSRDSRTGVAQVLLDQGASISTQDSARSTALHYAVQNINWKVIYCLLDWRASIDAGNHCGETVCMTCTCPS